MTKLATDSHRLIADFFELLLPNEYVHRDVLRRQAETAALRNQIRVLLARMNLLLDTASQSDNPVEIGRLVEAARGCRLVIEEIEAPPRLH